jgi:hypothetical protein
MVLQLATKLSFSRFKVCKSVHRHTIQINQPTGCNNFSSLLLDVNWPDHDQQHCYHHAPTVKPEAATAVVELLMKGVRTPENVELHINVKY